MSRRILAFGLVAGLVISTSAVLGTDRLAPSVYPTIQAAINAGRTSVRAIDINDSLRIDSNETG